MRVAVNKDLCALTGECVTIAPEIFWFDGDDLIVAPELLESQREDAERAITLCPMQAIRWSDDAD